VRGKDQAEEVATDSRLTTKLAAIKAELPPKKAKHWMGQFQKAWDIVSSYENLSKREKTYANISQVSYEL
jgi:hypothetical protein